MLKELLKVFRYIDLIKALVARDLKIKYKNSFLGYVWTWLDPLLTMLVFILVFDILLNIQVKNFPLYLLTGLIPWIFFSTTVSGSVNAITGNASLIRKVYYPREIFPLTLTATNMVNMFLGLLVLIPVIAIYGLSLTPKIFFIQLPIALLFLITFGLALIFSFLNVLLRDMSYIVPFAVSLGFYVTPVFYIVEGRVSPQLYNIYMLMNPLAVILSLFRASLLGYPAPSGKYIISCFAVCVFIFALGYYIFKKNEDMMVKRI